ncbi:MAG: site-specific DNA-methyltransferase [bacterium]
MSGRAQDMSAIADDSVDLVVTSPPYPMIEMWDRVFARQDRRIAASLAARRGGEAFELMHAVLDPAWSECGRVLRPGGTACINVADATRTIAGDFRLYSNHSRVLGAFLSRGFAALPDILWRKQTNAPAKFMGSGMLPAGAYVTYEHEYVLVLRKGRRREFVSAEDKARRRESAFFWEERNRWFSDVWSDIRGAAQEPADRALARRSAAFPFELAYRLVCMFSVKGDVVLDPFAGTGTTLAAALAAGRSAWGIEADRAVLPAMRRRLCRAPAAANAYLRERLARHVRFAAERTTRSGPLRHTNVHYGFPVVTAQEREILLNDVAKVDRRAAGRVWTLGVTYQTGPQAEMVRAWSPADLAAYLGRAVEPA